MPVEPQLIAKVPQFRELPEGLQILAAKNSQAKRFAPIHMVMAHHTVPAFLVIVLRGQLQKTEVAEDGRITGISFVNPGEVLDWLSVVDGSPIICSVSTTKETDLLLLPINIARQIIKDSSDLANLVLQQLALDLRRNTEQRQLLTLPNAFQRIFVQIVHLAEQNPDKKITNLPKQHEIAAMVNTSRETVSRAIQMLVKNGVLVKHGHRFVVQHTDQLKQLAASGGATNVPARKTDKY